MKISIGQAWTESRAFLAAEGRLVWSIALAFLLLPAVIVYVVTPDPGVTMTNIGLGLFSLLFSLVMAAGRLAIVRLAVGPSVSVGEALRAAARRLASWAGAMILLLGPFVLAMAFTFVATGLDPRGDPEVMARNPTFALMVLVLLPLFAWVSTLILLLAPVAVSEEGGSIRLVARSLALAKGNFWRLFGYLLALGIAFEVAVYVVVTLAGAVVEAGLGKVIPFSFAALVMGLVSGALGAALSVVNSAMVAQFYRMRTATGA